MPAPIYMDYQATTPTDPRVVEAMLPYFTERFGNPHSAAHRYGWEAEAAVAKARGQIAGLIGAEADEILFTSGATEANNLAVKGVAEAFHGRKQHLITVTTEHKCLVEAAQALAQRGWRVDFLPVAPDGRIDLDQLADRIAEDTALVSVMMVNNEIGVIQDIAAIGQLCRQRGVLVHTDAAQAVGKLDLDLSRLPVDLLSLSAHKMYGPKGIGALYHRRRVPLRPQMHGGGQEQGLRSGTLATPLCAGFGAAAALCAEQGAAERERLATQMARFRERLTAALPDLIINGSLTHRWVGNLNCSFPGLDGDRLLADLRGLAVSSGAACASAVQGPSYVLQALGRSEAQVKAALRFGIGRFTTDDEIARAADLVIAAVERQGGLKAEAA
ncbi:MAG: cysteine desulfurase family protein [Rhodothalassiaceae bacterium]